MLSSFCFSLLRNINLRCYRHECYLEALILNYIAIRALLHLISVLKGKETYIFKLPYFAELSY